MSLTTQILSQLPGALENLRRTDALWQRYREGPLAINPVIQESAEQLELPDWDAVICGGTLGILVGAALAETGQRVLLLERGRLRGRDQEWNISRQELQVLIELNLLSPAQLEQAIVTEYNPARISFHKGIELWVEDVLNVGVDPVFLLEALKAKFLAAGGQLVEQAAFESASLHPNGVSVQTSSGCFRTRLLLDAMGHFSPIVRQARNGQSPDAVCLVVGSCAQGFPDHSTGDLFASITPIHAQRQDFWEAFPARDGRTTYLFTYLDANPSRPSLEMLYEDYLRLLPDYQGVPLDQLQFQRALFGFFPCYRQPLTLPWNRILAIGDSSGSQSPLSFGGFGAMIRHLRRLSHGIAAALRTDQLDRQNLSLLQPYQPNLAVTWLFQRAMSVGVNQRLAPDQINQLLSGVFRQMDELGDAVLKPFLQDVVQCSALSQTMLRVSVAEPGLVLRVLPQVGPVLLLEWLGHYLLLAIYANLYALSQATLPLISSWIQSWIESRTEADRYRLERWLEAWQYGSGQDYRG